jgi:eukaryotic-like serine/threonine-protein kinase
VVKPYEAAAQFWPAYLRGQAYLSQGAGAEAAQQFQYIIDHRGQEPTSPLYPPAYLGLARAARLSSELDKSRAAYQNFFALREDADADLPELVAAREEQGQIK